MNFTATLKGAAAAALMGAATISPQNAMAQEAEYVIRFAAGFPPTTPQGRTAVWYIENIEERSGGRIKFEPFWIGSLVPSNEILGAVQDGLVDMGTVYAISFTGELPLSQIGNLPFLTRDAWVMQKVYADLLEEFPVFREEMERNNVHFLANTPTGGTGLMSKTPVTSLEDVEGLRTFTLGLYADVVAAAGANPISLAWSESYEALQNGVADSAVMYPMSIYANNFHEVTDHFTWIGDSGGLGQNQVLAVANLDFWDRLPTDLQEIVQQTMTDAETVWIDIWTDVMETDLGKLESGDGVQKMGFHTLSGEDVAEWQSRLGDPLQTWAENNADRADTAAIVARYKELEAKYQKELDENGYPTPE